MPSTQLPPFIIQYENSQEFHRLKQEIFTQHIYAFDTQVDQPLIIDAGAHIGLATLYFKKYYPQAQIYAIEPLPQNRALLAQNLHQNQLDQVWVVPSALAGEAGERSFYFDQSTDHWWSTASFNQGAWTKTQSSSQLIVPTVTLVDVLSQIKSTTGSTRIDMLKMDIEGAEFEVLAHADHHLRCVRRAIIELHPPSRLSEYRHLIHQLCEQFNGLGFATQLYQAGTPISLTQLPRLSGLFYLEANQE